MSIQIKSLTMTVPTKELSLAAPLDTFNTVSTANEVYDLYTTPNSGGFTRSAIAKTIRLVNTHATNAVKVSLYYNKPNANGQNRRRLLAPADILLPAGTTYIDDSELTLDPGDKIQAKADTANVIQYIISGVELDVT